MKKAFHLILLAIFKFVTLSNAQISFHKEFTDFQFFQPILGEQTFDNGYVICGDLVASGGSGYANYLIKFNEMGDTVWTRQYIRNFYATPFSVKQTSDSGFVITLTNQIMRVDKNGYFLWAKDYGLVFNSESIEQTSDGGFVIVGNPHPYPTLQSPTPFFIFKINASGQLLWSKFSTDLAIVSSLKKTSDDGFIITGRCVDTILNLTNTFLLKIDSVGQVEFSKNYKNQFKNQSEKVVAMADGTYMVSGVVNTTLNNTDIYLMHTDNIGNPLFVNVYGDAYNDFADDLADSKDGSVIMSGFINTATNIWVGHIFKVNSQGNMEWSKIYSDTLSSRMLYYSTTMDSSLLLMCYIKEGSPNTYNYHFLKVDVNDSTSGCPFFSDVALSNTNFTFLVNNSIGFRDTALLAINYPATTVGNTMAITTNCFVTGIYDETERDFISAYPNPFIDKIIIEGIERGGEIKLYDILGKQVLKAQSDDVKFIVDGGNLREGLYFLKYRYKGKSVCKKVIKL